MATTRYAASLLVALAAGGCSSLVGIGNLDVVGADADVETGSSSGADGSSSGSSGGGSTPSGSGSGGGSSSGGSSGGVDAGIDSGSASSDSGGDGGSSSGDGGDSGSDEGSPDAQGGGDAAATGACTDSQDESVEKQSTFPTSVADCALSNLEQEPATLDCIQNLGLTSACAGCYDAFAKCTYANCLSPCESGPGSSTCLQCEATYCVPAGGACAGI
jgi:hypothetical protein